MGTIHTINGGLPSISTSDGQLESLPNNRAQIEDAIAFTEDDLQHIQVSHVDPVVISLTIMNYNVKRILVDNESSTDVLYYDTF